MKLIAGNSNKDLGKQIASFLNIEYIDAYSQKFHDGEIKIQLTEEVLDKEILILQSLSNPVNDNLMELLLLSDAIKRAGVKKIIAIIPYLGYSRQDKKTSNVSPVPNLLISSLLKNSGITEIITIDIHSPENNKSSGLPLYSLIPNAIFAPIINQFNNFVIVAPDNGSKIRATNASKLVSSGIALINKIRLPHDRIIMDNVIGDVKNKNCLIIDDIVDTGKTLLHASNILLDAGAANIYAFVTHAVLSNNAAALIQNSLIKKIYITDSILTNNLPNKFCYISINKLLGDFIKKHCYISNYC